MTGSALSRRMLCLTMVLLVSGLSASAAWAALEAPPITVVFRFDDYGANEIKPIEFKIIDAFASRKVTCTFGAIPNCAFCLITPEKMDILNKAMASGAVECAVHGWTHNVLSLTQGRSTVYGSEFKGIYPQEQEDRITKARDFLEKGTGKKMTIFIPPYNSYDVDTMRVLEKLGFTCLSASTGGDVLMGSKLKMVPMTCDLDKVRRSVELARANAAGTPTMVVALMHAYDFSEYDPKKGHLSIEDLTEALDWALAQKDVRVLSVGQACDAIDELDAARFQRNARLFHLAFRVPPVLRDHYPAGVYFTAERAGEVLRKWVVYLLLAYAATTIVPGAIGFILAALVFPRSRWLKWALLVVGTALFAAACGAGLRNFFSSERALLTTTALMGGCAGMWLYWLKSVIRPAKIQVPR